MKHGLELDDSGKLGVWRSDLEMILTKVLESSRRADVISVSGEEPRRARLEPLLMNCTVWNIQRGMRTQ
jgi:hypothetical protein